MLTRTDRPQVSLGFQDNNSFSCFSMQSCYDSLLQPFCQDGSEEWSRNTLLWRNVEIIPELFLVPLLVWTTDIIAVLCTVSVVYFTRIHVLYTIKAPKALK